MSSMFITLTILALLVGIIIVYLGFQVIDSSASKVNESKIYWRGISKYVRIESWSVKVNEYTDGKTVDMELEFFNPTRRTITIKKIDISPGNFENVYIDGKLHDIDDLDLVLANPSTHKIKIEQYDPGTDDFIPTDSYSYDIEFSLDSDFKGVKEGSVPIRGKITLNPTDAQKPEPPTCAEETDACVIDSDCCGYLKCLSGTCTSTVPPPSCQPHGAGCYADSVCCSGRCKNNICAMNPCIVDGDICTIDEDCCSNALCTAGVCTPLCIADGGACSVHSDCCSDYCDPSNVCQDNICMVGGEYPCGLECCVESECRGTFCCPDDRWTGSLCCAEGEKDFEGVCCTEERWDGDSCCPQERWTGSSCCPEGEENYDGVCCDDERWTGVICCDEGKFASEGICCLAGEINCMGECCASSDCRNGNICCPGDKWTGRGCCDDDETKCGQSNRRRPALCCPPGWPCATQGSNKDCCSPSTVYMPAKNAWIRPWDGCCCPDNSYECVAEGRVGAVCRKKGTDKCYYSSGYNRGMSAPCP